MAVTGPDLDLVVLGNQREHRGFDLPEIFFVSGSRITIPRGARLDA